MVTTFAVLNLFVGIIVDAMQSQHQADAHAEREAMLSETATVLAELREIRADLAGLRAEIGTAGGDGGAGLAPPHEMRGG